MMFARRVEVAPILAQKQEPLTVPVSPQLSRTRRAVRCVVVVCCRLQWLCFVIPTCGVVLCRIALVVGGCAFLSLS